MAQRKKWHLNIKHMCEMADVSHSGYYSWIQSEQYLIQKEQNDMQDFQVILKHFNIKIAARVLDVSKWCYSEILI